MYSELIHNSATAKIVAQMQLKPKQVIVIGDGLHTDVVGAWLLGVVAFKSLLYPIP